MRPALPAFVFAVLLLGAPAAHAAPTCLDRQGQTVRCGTPGALPVGVSLPQEAPRERPGGPGVGKLVGLAAFLAGLFALILLLPDFQGRWDGQETDEEARD
jgi:hypothetical protein